MSSELIAKRFDAYTVHCNHCEAPLDGEFGPLWFAEDQLSKVDDYLDDANWHFDLRHVDPEMNGYAAACANCWQDGWCEKCGNEIHAWQVTAIDIDGRIHETCEKPS